jgi:hypothetical protein
MPAARKAPWLHGLSLLCAAAAISGAGDARADDTSPAPSTVPAPTVAPAADLSTPVPFAKGTHFSLGWVRLQGAEECLSARELSRGVEARLHRPALGAPAEADVVIEGHVEPAEQGGFHAVVTITDAHGIVVGRRELDSGPTSCRDIDSSLALAIALMIDPDAAFAASADALPRPRTPPKPALPRPRPSRTPPPGWRSMISVGAVAGFGVLPDPAAGAFIAASFEPRRFFPVEVDAHLWLDQVPSFGQDVNVAFTRATLGVFLCPLDTHIAIVRLATCAGIEGGIVTAAGAGRDGLVEVRRAVVDPTARTRVDVRLAPHLALRATASLGIPTIRDTFGYRQDDGRLPPVVIPIYRLPAANGQFGAGIAIELP